LGFTFGGHGFTVAEKQTGGKPKPAAGENYAELS
jgi:hypothetical protein